MFPTWFVLCWENSTLDFIFVKFYRSSKAVIISFNCSSFWADLPPYMLPLRILYQDGVKPIFLVPSVQINNQRKFQTQQLKKFLPAYYHYRLLLSNSNFLFLMYFQLDVVDLWYFHFWIMLGQTIRLQRYKDSRSFQNISL